MTMSDDKPVAWMRDLDDPHDRIPLYTRKVAVPREPTEAMMDAASKVEQHGGISWGELMRSIWRAMYDAAM